MIVSWPTSARGKERINEGGCDQQLCEGNMRCQEAAPEVSKWATTTRAGAHREFARSMREKIKLAARLCPRQAITISDD